MSQSPPNTLGKYQIIREIARSNDIVYEGYDPVMNRRVAVKELATPSGSTAQQREDRLKRFLREARAAGSLVHPNIVTVFEVGEQSGRTFIAMEFLDGRTLREEIEAVGFLDPKRAVEVGIEVLSALRYAHDHGVIHRDIKPENVQILASGQVKLTDFGIARLTFEPNLTMDGQVFGTPSYMSPEQINGKEIDARSDLFSVGVLLYEMVSGQKPFTGDSVMAITYAIMNREPTQPAQANHSLWMIIQSALDKSPALRCDSAAKMIEALEGVQKQMASGSMILDPVSPAGPTASYAAPPTWLTGSQQAPPNQAPPLVNPFMPAPPPQQGGQPYQTAPYLPPANPYGQAQTPYGTPMPPQYAQTAPYQAPQLPNGIPVYYPPPPRQPLISAETRQFFAKLFYALIIMGTLIFLVIQAINALSSAFGAGAEAARVPASNAQPAVPLDSSPQVSAPVSAPVGSNPASTPGSGPNPANSVPASSAAARSTADPEGIMQTGEGYIDQATREDYDPKRQELWVKAADAFAAAIEISPSHQRELSRRAFEDFMKAADSLAFAQRYKDAREAVYKAKSFTTGDPEMMQLADQRLAEYGG